MGTYLNPGSGYFEKIKNSEIYIDKSKLLGYLNSVVNTSQRYVSVSRPRRFGKTSDADMICAYYDRTTDGESLFRGLDIEKSEAYRKHRNQYDVLRLNMINFLKKGKDIGEVLDRMTGLVIRELVKAYPEVDYFDQTDLQQTMADLYCETQKGFVVVIDEWDCVFRKYPDDLEGQVVYLDFLRDWLKDQSYIALAYMTGILPIKKYGAHSALNMFQEFSMTSPLQLAPYMGFREEDVLKLCEKYHRDFEQIRKWYNGYVLVSRFAAGSALSASLPDSGEEAVVYHMYAPLSVVNAISTGVVKNYWSATETYSALRDNINRNFYNLKETIVLLMNGNRQRVNIRKYQNDMTSFQSADDVLTMLTHLGYLGYDQETQEVYIPNKEIMDEFKSSVEDDQSWDVLFRALADSQELLEATWNRDADRIAELVEAAHMHSGSQTYHSEAALSYAIRLAYFNAEQYYTLIPEMQTGKGYADLVYIPAPKYPDKPALLIELKWNKDADTAMDQIRRQRYSERLSRYKGNIIMVAINYDREVSNESEEFKHHSCVVEMG